jgi:hypothetical protein
MVFDSHNPAHHIPINVPPPDGLHINEVDLKAIPELGRYDGLPHTFLLLDATILLVTNRSIINKRLRKVCHCTIIVVSRMQPASSQSSSDFVDCVLIERHQRCPTYGGQYHLTSCAAGQSSECSEFSVCRSLKWAP